MTYVMVMHDAHGGHLLYTRNLLRAMSESMGEKETLVWACAEEIPGELDMELGSIQLAPVFPDRSEEADRSTSTIAWILDRITYYIRSYRSLARFARIRNPRVMHFQSLSPWHGAILTRSLRRSGVSVVASVHNVVPHTIPYGVPMSLYRAIARSTYRSADALLVHTKALKDQLADELGIEHRSKIHVVPHGPWHPAKTQTLEERTEMADEKALLFFGVLRPAKGLDLLIEAMDLLPDFKLRVMGESSDDAYRHEIEGMKGSRSNVSISGAFVAEDDVPAVFEATSAVILPYRIFAAESGVVGLARTYGVPAVVSPAIAKADPRAMTWCQEFHELSPGVLAREIRELHDPERYAAACVAVRQAAEEAPTWEMAAEATVRVYQELSDRD